MNSPLNLDLDLDLNRFNLSEWRYEKIIEEIRNFEEDLDEEHEIAVSLASFGTSVTMLVTDIGFQNPDMLYFYGIVNGKDSVLIQHTSQLNLLLTSVERADKTKPVRRIGYRLYNDEN